MTPKEKMFNDWMLLKEDIQAIAGIVQNNIEIEEYEILMWLEQIDKFKYKFDELKRNTLNVVRLKK